MDPTNQKENLNFLLPENQISVETFDRLVSADFEKFVFKSGPLYLSTCYEEFSRKGITVSIASENQNSIELDKTNLQKCSTDRISPTTLLKSYHPGFDQWSSTFKKIPSSNRNYLDGTFSTDLNILIRLNRFSIKQSFFEPLFGSACLYTFVGDEFLRVSETLYFDATPDTTRKTYQMVYNQYNSPDNSAKLNGHTINIADANSSNQHFNMFVTSLPNEFRHREMYLVFQISKILTTDNDKAIFPYLNSKSGIPDTQKHKEAWERLSKFRQPIGFGISKINDENAKISSNNFNDFNVQFYSQKFCFSDSLFGQTVKEMFPNEGNQYLRYEALEIELSVKVMDIIEPDKLYERLKESKIINSLDNSLQPQLLEAQIPSEESQLIYSQKPFSLDHLGKFSSMLAVRKLISLVPLNLPCANTVSRNLKTKVDNSIYLYINQLDKFQSSHRNLTLKIELIELNNHLPENKRYPSVGTPHQILKNIYNHTSLNGPNFISDVYTKVSYHTKNPSSNEEIKIRLPDVLSRRHWVRFTAMHVHVKPQARKSSILSSIIRNNIEKDEIDASIIGIGYLPLVTVDYALIDDKEHNVFISEIYMENRDSNGIQTLTEVPVIKLKTRSLCSLVSSSKHIQSLFRNIPIPLGRLPSSSMPLDVASQICIKACVIKPREIQMVNNIQDLSKASSLELSKHFLVIMRILLRSLQGGTGSYDENYANPFKHCKTRCQAFLSILKVLDKVFGSSINSGINDDTSMDREILDSYLDHFLDEEVPLETIYIKKISNSMSLSMDVSNMTQSANERVSCQPSNNFPPPSLPTIELAPVEDLPMDEDNIDEYLSETMLMGSPVDENFEPIMDDQMNEDLELKTNTETATNTQEKNSRSNSEVDAISSSVVRPNGDLQIELENYGSDSLSDDNFDKNELIPSESDRPVTPSMVIPIQIDVSNNDSPTANISSHATPHSYGILQEESPSIEDKLFMKPESMAAIDNKRKSWGKFITEACWQSGKLVAIPEIDLSKNDEAYQNSAHYLEEISNHIVLQIERMIIEDIFDAVCYSISSQVIYHFNNSENDDHLAKSSSGYFVNNLTQEQILSRKRYRHSSKFEYSKNSNQLPFDIDKSWFKALDEGNISDEHDIQLNDMKTVDLLVKKFNTYDWRKSSQIHLENIKPNYDSLDGFNDRINDVLGIQDPKFALQLHWWPWLYEVLIHQYAAVLTLILKSCNLITSNNSESTTGSYLYENEVLQKYQPSSGMKEIRLLLTENGPILMKMILKSLSLRIIREGKCSPVIIDDQLMTVLENLIMLIAVEAATISYGIWRSRKLIQSLSQFLRDLFGLIIPYQVLRLIKVYFKAIRKVRKRLEEIELRLLMLEELSYFDHYVAVNYPFTLDAPLTYFNFSLFDRFQPSPALAAFTSMGIRYESSPLPFTFAHIILSEILASVRQEERRREATWEILRDLFVRHAYDARYQSLESQKRIINMYLPFIPEILKEIEYLKTLKYNSNERREILICLLYLLSGVPDRIFRNFIRTITNPISNQESTSAKSPISPEIPSNTSDHITHSSKVATSATSSARIISMKRSRNVSIFSTSKSTSQYLNLVDLHKSSQVYQLLSMLHLIIDTFEEPNSKRNDLYIQLLSPSIVSEIPIDSEAGPSRRTSNVDLQTTQQRFGMANTLLANLDSRMQTRKSSTTGRKSIGTNNPPQNLYGSSGAPTNSSNIKSDERKWLEHARKVSIENNLKEKPILSKFVTKEEIIQSTQQLSLSAIRIVMNVLWILFSECPNLLDSTVLFPSMQKAFQDDPLTFILRESNIDEALLSNFTNFNIIPFMRMALGVILHALHCNFDDEAITELFLFANAIIRLFGARVFLLALEDSLQYWIRITLRYFTSKSLLVQESATNFLLCLFRSTYLYVGNFTLISNTILAVINDVLWDVLELNSSIIQTYSDEDKVLQGFFVVVENIRKLLKLKKDLRDSSKLKNHRTPLDSTFNSFSTSLLNFLKNLEIILIAHGDLRRYVSHPVSYDFLGANMLDGPFDERTGQLTQSIRVKRKAIKSDPIGINYNSSVNCSVGFQMEEIMLHFLQASEVYDIQTFPRFRIQWLENLARLHEIRGNRAEGAEVRWRIFMICYQVENIWQDLWVPKPPLSWLKRGSFSNESNLNGLNSPDTSPGLAPNSTSTSNSTLPNPQSNSCTNSQETERNFFKTFLDALNEVPYRSWSDIHQYWKHMETCLMVTIERFCALHLLSLAERSSSHLIQLNRMTKRTENIIQEYARLSSAFKATLEKGITHQFAMGTFFRVHYSGVILPDYIRNKEFIYRNTNFLHVSEFHQLVINYVKSIVNDKVEVKIIQDTTSLDSINLAKEKEGNIVYILLNAVKPLLQSNGRGNIDRLWRDKLKKDNSAKNSVSSSFINPLGGVHLNQVSTFTYSIPFTQDGTRTHAKRIEDQWMKTTILTVAESFPYILTRQLVLSRETFVLTPIEVSIYDIEERIDSMEDELEINMKNSSDMNNLMRIVQGTAMPQVNAGAGEVAKVFLHPDRINSDTTMFLIKIQSIQEFGNLPQDNTKEYVEGENQALSPEQQKILIDSLNSDLLKYQQLLYKLRVILTSFLLCLRQLLLRTRKIFVDSVSSASVSLITELNIAANASTNSALSYKGPVNSNTFSATVTAQKSYSSASISYSPPLMTPNSSTNNRKSLGAFENAPSALPPSNVSNINSQALTASEISNIKWQIEMERAYETLVQTILPFISEIPEAKELARY